MSGERGLGTARGMGLRVYLSLPLGLGTVWEEKKSRVVTWAALKQNGKRWEVVPSC